MISKNLLALILGTVIINCMGVFLLSNSFAQTKISDRNSEDITLIDPILDPNEKKCEQVVSAKELSDFSERRYFYNRDSITKSKDFICIFSTKDDSGSRNMNINVLADPLKIEFESTKDVNKVFMQAPDFGPDAFFSKDLTNLSNGETVTKLALHVYQNEKTYIIGITQYKSQEETMKLIKDIFEKLAKEG